MDSADDKSSFKSESQQKREDAARPASEKALLIEEKAKAVAIAKFVMAKKLNTMDRVVEPKDSLYAISGAASFPDVKDKAAPAYNRSTGDVDIDVKFSTNYVPARNHLNKDPNIRVDDDGRCVVKAQFTRSDGQAVTRYVGVDLKNVKDNPLRMPLIKSNVATVEMVNPNDTSEKIQAGVAKTALQIFNKADAVKESRMEKFPNDKADITFLESVTGPAQGGKVNQALVDGIETKALELAAKSAKTSDKTLSDKYADMAKTKRDAVDYLRTNHLVSVPASAKVEVPSVPVPVQDKLHTAMAEAAKTKENTQEQLKAMHGALVQGLKDEGIYKEEKHKPKIDALAGKTPSLQAMAALIKKDDMDGLYKALNNSMSPRQFIDKAPKATVVAVPSRGVADVGAPSVSHVPAPVLPVANNGVKKKDNGLDTA